MSDADTSGAGGMSDDRERRLQALRALARDQQSSASTTPAAPATPSTPPPAPKALPSQVKRPAPARRPSYAEVNALKQLSAGRPSPWLALVVGVIVVALLATLGVVISRQRAPTTTSASSILTGATLSVTPQLDGVACPSGAAISPRGGAVVIVGYQTECPDSDYATVNEPVELAVYDTANGHTLASVTLPLDTLSQKLGVALVAQSPGFFITSPNPTLLLGAPLWSPDGQRIEVPFVVQTTCFCEAGADYGFQQSGAPTLVGLLDLSATGRLNTVLSAPYSSAQRSVEWDVAQKTLVAGAGQLAAAQSYRWSGAQLRPASPLGAHAPLGPIGDPAHADAFSLWQTGWSGLVYVSAGGPTPTPNASGASAQTFQQVPGVLTLTPTFAAWSPDGRYLLLPNFSALALLPSGRAPDPTALQRAGLSQAPQVAPRDAALASLFAAFAHAAPGTVATPATPATPDALAWSPDGKLLAVAQDIPDNLRPQDQPVTLLDTRTGKTVATLTPAVSPQNTLEFNPITLAPSPLTVHPQLQWSPDGARLILLNPSLGTITVWKVKS